MPRPHYPPSTTGLLRITKSCMASYRACPIRWHLDNECEDQGYRSATVAQLIGTALAAGAAADNRAKQKGAYGIPLREIVETSVDAYEKERADSKIPEPKIEIERGKDSAANAARTFGTEMAPRTKKVILVEEPIVATCGEVEIAGTPDLFTEGEVVDYKTGKPWDQQRTNESEQLTLYAMLYQARYGRIPDRVTIESLYVRNGVWKAIRYTSTRRQEDFDALYNVVKGVAMEMAASTLEKAMGHKPLPGAWWCSARWCPHWGNGCPVVAGRR